ncbi:hypothetical protein ACET9V_16865 [Aeromonas caviae]|uniref:hypothetical protein n=1 Tax=Aeromonas caviae TaxID=648 RepID=UPI0038D0F60F
MSWLRKGLMQTWAALVALFTRQAVAKIPTVVVAPVVEAPAEIPVPPAGQLQPLDFDIAPGSPLKALIDQMEKAFPVPSIKPGSDMASLQYAAGQRAVVDWVRMQQKRGQV